MIHGATRSGGGVDTSDCFFVRNGTNSVDTETFFKQTKRLCSNYCALLCKYTLSNKKFHLGSVIILTILPTPISLQACACSIGLGGWNGTRHAWNTRKYDKTGKIPNAEMRYFAQSGNSFRGNRKEIYGELKPPRFYIFFTFWIILEKPVFRRAHSVFPGLHKITGFIFKARYRE